MKNCLFEQLKAARLEAKKAGIDYLYSDGALYIDQNKARLNTHTFKLEGLKLPPEVFAVQVAFNRLLGVLRAAARITKDYKVRFADSVLYVEGRSKNTKFKIRLSYVALLHPCYAMRQNKNEAIKWKKYIY